MPGNINSSVKKALIIFCKYPLKGKVKTRLAVSLGHDFAINFYRKCAGRIFSEASKLQENGVDVYIFYDTGDNPALVKEWVDKDFIFYRQRGNTLGEKMYNAFKKVFETGKKQAIIIGTDVPDLSSALLKKAFAWLDKIDFVIGPSIDGGYYLLGMKRLVGQIFSGITWSADSVFDKTIQKIDELKSTAEVLPLLYDIDTEKDYNNWKFNKERFRNNEGGDFF